MRGGGARASGGSGGILSLLPKEINVDVTKEGQLYDIIYIMCPALLQSRRKNTISNALKLIYNDDVEWTYGN